MRDYREHDSISGGITLAYLDEEDLIILREFQKEGRISFVELSRKTGIPDSTIHDKTR